MFVLTFPLKKTQKTQMNFTEEQIYEIELNASIKNELKHVRLMLSKYKDSIDTLNEQLISIQQQLSNALTQKHLLTNYILCYDNDLKLILNHALQSVFYLLMEQFDRYLTLGLEPIYRFHLEHENNRFIIKDIIEIHQPIPFQILCLQLNTKNNTSCIITQSITNDNKADIQTINIYYSASCSNQQNQTIYSVTNIDIPYASYQTLIDHWQIFESSRILMD